VLGADVRRAIADTASRTPMPLGIATRDAASLRRVGLGAAHRGAPLSAPGADRLSASRRPLGTL